MNRLLLIAVAVTAIHYALKARRVPELARALASREVELAAMTHERDVLLTVALKRQQTALLARIAADVPAAPAGRPIPKVIHPERTYTLPGLLRVVGLRNVPEGLGE